MYTPPQCSVWYLSMFGIIITVHLPKRKSLLYYLLFMVNYEYHYKLPWLQGIQHIVLKIED